MPPPARSPIPSSSSLAHHHHHHLQQQQQHAHLHAHDHDDDGHAGAAKGEVLKGLLDVWWSDDEDDDPECPLCMEEMDLSDVNFKPCPCGYQICRFCHHHIIANLNKRCPACRRVYTEEDAEFVPVAPEEIKRLTLAKKNKQKTNRELDALGRRPLKDVRVIVKGCVYVTGMAVGQEGRAEEQLATLRSNDYFGQYGKISKLVLHKRPASSSSDGSSPASAVGIYITYLRREDAARAIAALDGFPSPSVPGQVLRASYGTAKYCEAWLRNVRCEAGQACMGLHEWGDERDVFRREDLTTLNVGIRKPALGVAQGAPLGASGSQGAPSASASAAQASSKLGKGRAEIDSNTALPRTASWASRPGAPSSTAQPSGLASLPPNPTLAAAQPPPPSLGANRPLSSTAKTKIPGQLGALAAPAEPRTVTVKLSTGRTAGTVKDSPVPRERVVVSLGGTADKDKGAPPGLAAAVKDKDRSLDKASSSASSSRPSTPALKEAVVHDASPAPAASSSKRERAREAAQVQQTPTPSPTPPPPSSGPPPPSTSQPSTPAPSAAAPAPIVGTAPPPGLSLPPSRVATPQPPAPATAEDEPYHPSTATQALLSDVTNQRRSPSPPPAGQQQSSFGGASLPDFGRMLDFDDGFAFQMRVVEDKRSRAPPPHQQQAYGHDALPPHLQPQQPLQASGSAGVGPGAFSPFGFGLPSALGGILGTPPASSPYVGSFDPFGDASSSLGGQENDDPSASRRSRFDFARKNSRPTADSPRAFGTGGLALPPFGGDQHLGHGQHPSAAMGAGSRRGSQDLAFGGGFAWNVLHDGAGGRASGTTSPALGRPQHGQQHPMGQHPPPPPPGLSPLPSSASIQPQRQQQQQQSYPGGPPPNLPLGKHQQQQYAPIQQQQQNGSASSTANNWIHQLVPRPGSTTGGNVGGAGQQGMGQERMAFARQHQQGQQQQQQGPPMPPQQQSQSQTLKEMLGVGAGGGNMGFGGYGGGNGAPNGAGDYGFQDPAIMSMRSSNQQRQQQHQAFASSPSGGPHSPFSPLANGGAGYAGEIAHDGGAGGLSAFASFGGQQQDGRNSRLMQQQQQGYFGGGRTPSPANLGGLSSEPTSPTPSPSTAAVVGAIGDGLGSSTMTPTASAVHTPVVNFGEPPSTVTPPHARSATNPLISVQEPTPRQASTARFGTDAQDTGSPERKPTAAGEKPAQQPLPSPLGAPQQPERDTSWELDSEDETAEKADAEATKKAAEADVRAALAAAAQTKPAPVTISLKTKAPVAVKAPAPVPAAAPVEPAKSGKGKKGALAKTATPSPAPSSTAPSRTATPDAAAATPVKKGWALPDPRARSASPAPSVADGPTPGEAATLSRPSTPVATRGRQATKVVAAESASRATSVASSAAGALSSAKAANRKRSPSPPPLSAVEQAPIFSRKAKKEKPRTAPVPKKKAGKAALAITAAAADAAETAAAEDVLNEEERLETENALALSLEPVVKRPQLALGDLFLPAPPAEPSSLSQLLHQLAPVLVASSLSFIAPLSHTRDLVEPLSVASCLEPEPLAVALSALTTPTSDVTMEDAVAAFHQLLTLLTDTITGILNILPRDPPRDQDVAKRFGAMFMDVRRGTGLATKFAQSVDGAARVAAGAPVPGQPHTAAAAIEAAAGERDKGEQEVEKLKTALYQRANYLAEQLTRLEDLHEEINSMAVEALVKNYAENAPAGVTTNSGDRVEELEAALLMARADVGLRSAEFAQAKNAAMGAFYAGNLVDLVWAGQGEDGADDEDDDDGYDSRDEYDAASYDEEEEEEEIEEEVVA